jgi:hypothetical protein
MRLSGTAPGYVADMCGFDLYLYQNTRGYDGEKLTGRKGAEIHSRANYLYFHGSVLT